MYMYVGTYIGIRRYEYIHRNVYIYVGTYINGVYYSALMKLIICHFGHGAGITNEHMTLDPKMTRLETICKEPERKDRHKNTREVISEKVSALCLFTYMTVRPGARARQRYLPLVHNWVAEDNAHHYNCWKVDMPILTKTPLNSMMRSQLTQFSLSLHPFQILSSHLKKTIGLDS